MGRALQHHWETQKVSPSLQKKLSIIFRGNGLSQIQRKLFFFPPLREAEEQQFKSKSELEEVLHQLSSLQEENRVLSVDKNNASVHLRKVVSELGLAKQVNRYFI